MKTLGRTAKLRIAAVAGAAVMGIGMVAATHVAGAAEQKPAGQLTAVARAPLPTDVLAAIRSVSPGSGFLPFAAYRASIATGDKQTYTCTADGVWPAASTPTADLDLRASLLPMPPTNAHRAGPTWTAPDGSQVRGTVREPRVPVTGTIPWLLLDVSHTVTGGAMDKVSHISRVLTEGGLPPAGSCTPNATTDSTYSAWYVFWTAI